LLIRRPRGTPFVLSLSPYRFIGEKMKISPEKCALSGILIHVDYSRNRFKDGQCVRLLQGKKDAVTIYSEIPLQLQRNGSHVAQRCCMLLTLTAPLPAARKIFPGSLRSEKRKYGYGGGRRHQGNINRRKLLAAGINRVILELPQSKTPSSLQKRAINSPARFLSASTLKTAR